MRTISAPNFASLKLVLAEEIERLRHDDPLRPIVVITPGDLGRETVRRALGARGGTLGVSVRSLNDWITDLTSDEIERRHGHRLREPAFERLVAKIVERRLRRARRSGPLAAAAETPGFPRAMASSLADLAIARFDATTLASAPRRDAIRRELIETFTEVAHEADASAYYDRRAEEALVAERLRTATVSSPLLFFGFHDLTALQREIVLSAAGVTPVVLLVPGPGDTGDTATTPLVDWARLHGDFEARERTVTSRVTLAQDAFESVRVEADTDALELATFATEADEVRGILRRIRREVEERERSYDEFLVAVPREGPSPALIRRLFSKAGVPLTDRAGVPATRTHDGRRALTLARAASAPRDARLHEALTFLRRAAEGAPPSHEADADATADPSHDSAPEAFEAFLQARDWTETIRAFGDLHEAAYGIAPPADVAEALEALALVHGATPVRPREFAGALAATLASIVHRATVDAEDGDATVLLVRLDNARGLSRPFVFLPGWIDGVLRRVPGEDPLLPDWLRESWNDAFEHDGRVLPLRFAAREERLLLARFALETAAETAVISWARRARTGADARNPAGLLVDVASRRAGRPLEADDAELFEWAPWPDRAEAARDAIDRTDLELAILGTPSKPRPTELAPLFADDVAPSLRRAIGAIEDRWRPDRLTNHDGVLTDPRAIELVWNRMRPDATPWSPTRLEALSNCPFAFFVEHVLRLRPQREPGDDYDPMERGEIFHALVETIYRALHEHDALPLEPSALPGVFRLLDDLVAHVATSSREAAARVQRSASLAAIRNDAAIVLARDAHRTPSGSARPAYFELAFGMDDAPAPAIDLGDTRLPLRGKADRVDLVNGDRFDVVDYKTGRVRAKSHRLTSADEGKITVHLQAPLYLVALAELLSKSPRDATLYHATADQAFQEVRFDAHDLERVRPRLLELLGDSLDHARRGWFPCTPGHACCRRDLRLACGPSVATRFRRKAGVDALVDHQAMLDGLDAEAGA